MSNFWKLIPVIALTTAVALVLAGVLMALYIERSYKAQKIDEVGVQAAILASTVAAALVFGDHEAAQEYVDALRVNPEVRTAAVFDASGTLFASYRRSPEARLPAQAEAPGTRVAGERLIVVAPVRQGDAALGTVYVETVTEPFTRRLERYGVIALLVTMAVVVVAVLGVAQSALGNANAELAHRASDLATANENLQAQIAEREKVEEALRQAQKMEAIGQLTGGVAHDFNNLLQVILGNLGAAQRRLQRDSATGGGEVLRHVEAAIGGGERAATLTQRLLAFSRRQPLAPKPLDVNRLVSGMTDLLHRTLGEAIDIETVLAGDLWRTSADANQLENSLLNLAVNAKHAMLQGGRLRLETANARLDATYAALHEEVQPGDYVVIAVTDTGTGMTKDVLTKAFEPFFTTKDFGQGTGLGLSQVYGFMKQSGGHAKIYSEPGHGTTVNLYLPRLTAAEPAAPTGAAALRASPAGAADELILVVEDDPGVRAFSVQMLRELGYSVIEAANAEAALDSLRRSPGVRLLFTDVGLPGGVNGRQLAERARWLRPGLRILYTTGYAGGPIVHRGRLDPGVELIGKPFSYFDLATRVRAVLERDI
jgi:signal transduction histidine kinase